MGDLAWVLEHGTALAGGAPWGCVVTARTKRGLQAMLLAYPATRPYLARRIIRGCAVGVLVMPTAKPFFALCSQGKASGYAMCRRAGPTTTTGPPRLPVPARTLTSIPTMVTSTTTMTPTTITPRCRCCECRFPPSLPCAGQPGPWACRPLLFRQQLAQYRRGPAWPLGHGGVLAFISNPILRAFSGAVGQG